jgi:hypothetical protein
MSQSVKIEFVGLTSLPSQTASAAASKRSGKNKATQTLVLFLATIALVFASVRTFLSWPLARLREQSPWVVAALAASVALALHQIVDDFVFYPKVGGAWFAVLGIAAAALR